MKILVRIIIFFSSIWINSSFAVTPARSLGQSADDIVQSLQGFIHVVHNIFIISIAGLTMAGIIKFIDHRRNPEEVPLRHSLIFFLIALAFLILAFIPTP